MDLLSILIGAVMFGTWIYACIIAIRPAEFHDHKISRSVTYRQYRNGVVHLLYTSNAGWLHEYELDENGQVHEYDWIGKDNHVFKSK